MVGTNTGVMAIFGDENDVNIAVSRLREGGFRATDISILMADNRGSKDFAHKKETKAPEGATLGGATGAVIGGAFGWLTGIGAIALTGFGPLIAAGPIMAALAGMGVGGAVGSVAGALIGMGLPEYEAKRFEGMIKEGKALLSVHCDNSQWVARAKDILKDSGGQDIAAQSEEPGSIPGTNTVRPIAVTPPGKVDTSLDSSSRFPRV
jgi:hypothetical protein